MIEQLHDRPRAGLSYSHIRIDGRRDTEVFVIRNVSNHVHITLGKNEATLILHPHMAQRLVANIQAVLEGTESAAK